MGGSLKAQKECKTQLDAARNELLSIYKIGRKSADGVEPSDESHVNDGLALEAIEDALSDLNSRNSQWRDKVKGLEDEIVLKDEQAQVAVAALTAEKEEADARANEAELNAIREIDIMHEEVDQLEGRVSRLRVMLVDNISAMQSTLEEVGGDDSRSSAALLTSPDPDSANDEELFSGAKERVIALRESMVTVVKEKETYVEQCIELGATSAEATVRIANLEVELRTIGEASEKEQRDKETAVAEAKQAKQVISEMETRLTAALERAQHSESLLNKPVKTMGTQAGPGLAEPPKPKVKKSDGPLQKEAIKPNVMDDEELVPEHVEKIIPREPPPPPRVLKPPNGWGSTWATAPRTRPDPTPQSTISREGTGGLYTYGGENSSRRDAFPPPPPGYETASDRLGLRNYFEMMANQAAAARRGGGDNGVFPVSNRAHVVSETNPRPLVKAEEQHATRPTPPVTPLRPQTSPAVFDDGGSAAAASAHRRGADRIRSSFRTSMHPAVSRQEIAMGTLELGGGTLEGASGIEVDYAQHAMMVPARLGAVMSRRSSLKSAPSKCAGEGGRGFE